jgi:hypothetical protein
MYTKIIAGAIVAGQAVISIFGILVLLAMCLGLVLGFGLMLDFLLGVNP